MRQNTHAALVLRRGVTVGLVDAYRMAIGARLALARRTALFALQESACHSIVNYSGVDHQGHSAISAAAYSHNFYVGGITSWQTTGMKRYEGR